MFSLDTHSVYGPGKTGLALENIIGGEITDHLYRFWDLESFN